MLLIWEAAALAPSALNLLTLRRIPPEGSLFRGGTAIYFFMVTLGVVLFSLPILIVVTIMPTPSPISVAPSIPSEP